MNVIIVDCIQIYANNEKKEELFITKYPLGHKNI